MGLMLALIAATFHHMVSGLQVVIEDYVHQEEVKVPAVLAVKGVGIVLALVCVVAVLKIGL
jgi:succinate dehydrogenase / fumarate reductase membrane anchor subunit